jgi:predicted ATPase
LAILFRVISRSSSIPSNPKSIAILAVDNWDDFSFKTLFYLTIYDINGTKHDIGSVKIGYLGQSAGKTSDKIDTQFERLSDQYFSLGQDVEYYKYLVENFPKDYVDEFLQALGDVVYDQQRLELVQNEAVFGTSLLRSVSQSVISGQFKRILDGGILLTEFNFTYQKPATANRAGLVLNFQVTPSTQPSTNMHVLIGRNGVGKTTLLNDMVKSIIDDLASVEESGEFLDNSYLGNPISHDYFSSVTSVSFSAFDPFIPPVENNDRSKGTSYFYIGLKKTVIDERGRTSSKIKDIDELRSDFVNSLEFCFSLNKRKELWLAAIVKLESDDNFADMELSRLAEMSAFDRKRSALSAAERMSSGHAIVLISITKLVQTIEEKSLVLIDEPESHLHPPLLSAFIRALSDLLISRNALAIIATHSPVVLQEVPKSCLWNIRWTR